MAFLRQHHPFSELDEDGVSAVAQSVQIVHVPARETVLLEGGSPADAIGVVRKGAMDLLIGDVVVDQLDSGEVYGLMSVMTRRPPSVTVRAAEDTLSYLVPASVARRVFADEHAVAWSQPVVGGQRQVGVRGHPGKPVPDQGRRLHDDPPRYVR